MNELFKLDKTAFSITHLSDPPDEKDYWLKRTPAERWQAVEFLRQLNYGYHPDTTRLQRVFEVVEQA